MSLMYSNYIKKVLNNGLDKKNKGEKNINFKIFSKQGGHSLWGHPWEAKL